MVLGKFIVLPSLTHTNINIPENCDEAHQELVKEIQQAKAELKRKGVNLDAGLKTQ